MGGRLQYGGEELLEQRPEPGLRQPLLDGPRQHELGLVEQLEVVLPGQVQPVALPPQQMPYDDLAQHRQALGAQHDQATEADIGEVTVGEGEL